MNHTNENIKEYIDMLANKRRSNIHKSVSEYDHFDTVSYYVSPNGSDENDGLSPATAWKTLDKANSLVSDKECNLLFERGGLWRGSVKVNGNVTVSAYGSGDKPMFYGSPESGADEAKWTKVNGTENVWKFYRNLPDCGTVVFDDAKCGTKMMPDLVDGKFDFDVRKDMSCDLAVFSDAADCDGALYLRCDDGNPGAVFESVEFSVRADGLTSLGDNVTVNNLAFKYYGGNGATAANGVKGFIIFMNEYKWIGGSVCRYEDGKGVRYGCGVEICGDIERHFVDNCYFTEIYDAAISLKAETPMLMKKVIYSNNLIENCTVSMKYVRRGIEKDKLIDDFMIMSNICRKAGDGWGSAQHSEKCIPSHIRTCRNAENTADKMIVKNNIFDESAGQLVFISAKDGKSLPRMLKNIYVQQTGKLFGAYGVSPVQPTVYEDIGQTELANKTKEYAAEFYFC